MHSIAAVRPPKPGSASAHLPVNLNQTQKLRTGADDDDFDARLWLGTFVVVAIGAVGLERRHVEYSNLVYVRKKCYIQSKKAPKAGQGGSTTRCNRKLSLNIEARQPSELPSHMQREARQPCI
jgi:hypothetical protein